MPYKVQFCESKEGAVWKDLSQPIPTQEEAVALMRSERQFDNKPPRQDYRYRVVPCKVKPVCKCGEAKVCPMHGRTDVMR